MAAVAKHTDAPASTALKSRFFTTCGQTASAAPLAPKPSSARLTAMKAK